VSLPLYWNSAWTLGVIRNELSPPWTYRFVRKAIGGKVAGRPIPFARFYSRTDPRRSPEAFCNSRRKVLRKKVRRRAREVGLKRNVCLIVLRRTCALAASKAGINPINVGRQIGYRSMRTMTINLNELARGTEEDIRANPVRYHLTHIARMSIKSYET